MAEISTLYKDLCNRIGTGKVYDDEAVVVSYGFDSSVVPFSKPALVILPETRQDVVEVLTTANRNKIPVTVMSGGVNISGLCVPQEGGVVLDLARMDKILEINTDSGYAVIEPGVTFDNFTAALSKKDFRCHVPTAPGGATPLGNYLLKPSGSLANRHLDSILSLEVILPDGTVVHTGSDAFAHAGPHSRYGPFPDLTGLFCCAYGTLGVVTRAAMRIYPKNESARIHLAAFDNFESSVKFVKDVVNNNIVEHCIIWNAPFIQTFNITARPLSEPAAPTELWKLPKDLPYNIVTSSMSGYEKMMVVAEDVCDEVANKHGGRALSVDEMEHVSLEALQSWRSYYLDYHQRTRDQTRHRLGRYVAWIVEAEPKDIVQIEKMVLEGTSKLGVPPVMYYSMPFDFGRAMFLRVFTFVDPVNQELINDAAATFKRLYDVAISRYGAIPYRYRRGTEVLKNLGGYNDLLNRIKESIDPHNILNPGLIE